MIFKERFDYCIVDEASQITLPLCIGPILRARYFVLVGDQFQLPPIVLNPQLKQAYPVVSLFEFLSDEYPHRVLKLKTQYRMNEEIMYLSSNLFYDGVLQCGNEIIRKQRCEMIQNCCNKPDVCYFCFANERNVAFLNTNGHCAELRLGDLIKNETECDIVSKLVFGLINGNESIIVPSDIGIITPYKVFALFHLFLMF